MVKGVLQKVVVFSWCGFMVFVLLGRYLQKLTTTARLCRKLFTFVLQVLKLDVLGYLNLFMSINTGLARRKFAFRDWFTTASIFARRVWHRPRGIVRAKKQLTLSFQSVSISPDHSILSKETGSCATQANHF